MREQSFVVARSAALAGLVVTAAALATACSWGRFDDFENQASTIVLERPDDYPRAEFGLQLSAYEAMSMGKRVSRLATNAGAGSPPQIFGVWNGTDVALGAPLVSVCEGAGGGTCSAEAGAGLAGTSVAGDPCVVVGEPDANEVTVKCEAAAMRGIAVAPTSGERFGQAIVGLPESLAAALVGAPAAAGGGKLYTLTVMPGGLFASSTPVGGLDLALMGAGGSLGGRIVATPATGGAMFATSSHVGTSARVAWASLTAPGTAVLRACIDDPSTPVLGTSMALGRIRGDDTPDLALGIRDPAGMADRAGLVAVYDGGMLPDACSAPTVAPFMITCPEGLQGIACAGSGFGAAVALGDIDADGDDDLVIGAPFAAVAGTLGAGAVYVVAGPLTGTPAASNFVVLTDSTPDQNAHLGAALAVPRTKLDGTPRGEVAAGAPGANAVYVFLCSGLGTDTPAIGPRCIPM